MTARLALRGDLLDFTGRTGLGRDRRRSGVRCRPDHWLLVDERPHRRRAAAEAPGAELGSATTTAAGCCCPASSTPTCTARSST